MNIYNRRFNEELEKQYPYVDDYGIFVPTEEYKRHDDPGIFKCILTKELFIEAYNKWIKEDLAPIIHAKWEDGDGRVEYLYGNPDDPYEMPTYRCSACKCEEEYASDYCPNCGANMDLEE